MQIGLFEPCFGMKISMIIGPTVSSFFESATVRLLWHL